MSKIRDFFDRKTLKMKAAAQEYADSRGVYLYDQTPRELKLRERLWMCFWRGLIIAAAISTYVCCFATTLEIPAKPGPIIFVTLLVSMVLSFAGFNQVLYDLSLIPAFIIFSVYSFLNLRLLNSGFSAIINIILGWIDEVYNLGGLRDYTEMIQDRPTTTTTTLALISAVMVLLLLMLVRSNKQRYASMLFMDAFAFGFFFLMRLDPQISWVAMMLGSQLAVILIQNSIHNRTAFKKEGVSFRKSPRFAIYSYVIQSNSGTLWKSLTLGAVLMLIVFVILSPITGLFTYNPVVTNKKPARAALDRIVSDLALNGLAGLFNEYANVGGVSSGKLGGISNVTLDFQTDFTLDFVPYTTDRIFLKQHTFDTYHITRGIGWTGREQSSSWVAEGCQYYGPQLSRYEGQNLPEGTPLSPTESLYRIFANEELLEEVDLNAIMEMAGDPSLENNRDYLMNRFLWSPSAYPYSGPLDGDSLVHLTGSEKKVMAELFRETYITRADLMEDHDFTAKMRITPQDYIEPMIPYGGELESVLFSDQGGKTFSDFVVRLYLDNYHIGVNTTNNQFPYELEYSSVTSYNRLRYQLEEDPKKKEEETEKVFRIEYRAKDSMTASEQRLMELMEMSYLYRAEQPGEDDDWGYPEGFQEYLENSVVDYFTDYYLNMTCTDVPEDLKEYIQQDFADEYSAYGLREAGEKVREGRDLGIPNYGYNELIESISDIFATEYMYTYSPGKTPKDKEFIRYFLETQKHGYCVYFASSAAMILRSYGVPARYCEGYAVDATELSDNAELLDDADENEWFQGANEFEGAKVVSLDVTDSSAHAWVEIYFEGYGWIPVEFTVARMEEGQAADFWSGLGALFQGLDTGDNNNPTDDPDTEEDKEYTPPDMNGILKKLFGSLGILVLIIAGIIAGFAALKALYRQFMLFGQKDLSGRIIFQYRNLNRILHPERKNSVPNASHSNSAELLCNTYGLDPEETGRFITLVERISYSRENGADAEEYRFSEAFYRKSVDRIREVKKKLRAEQKRH